MLIGNFVIDGSVTTECDRCTDPVDVLVEGEYRIVFKFGDEPSDDESLVIVYPEEFEIDVKENILELITVSLPARAVHDEGACNEEMTSLLSEYVLVSIDEQEEDEALDEDVDPRWAALNKLKDEGADAPEREAKGDPDSK